jgi:hypothetical protein
MEWLPTLPGEEPNVPARLVPARAKEKWVVKMVSHESTLVHSHATTS